MELISWGTSKLISFLPQYGIYILKIVFVIYDPMSSPYSLCALSYVLNVE